MRKQNKFGFFICLILIFGILIIFNSQVAIAAAKQSVTATKVKNAPAGYDDPAWQKATAVNVHFEGKEIFAGKKTSVTTKAVYKA